MDQQQSPSSSYNSASSRPHLFNSASHLPPPSHLHLPSLHRSNTLPPLPASAPAAHSHYLHPLQQHPLHHNSSDRYPPPSSYHPSLTTPTTPGTLPSLPHSPAGLGAAPPWSASAAIRSRDDTAGATRRRDRSVGKGSVRPIDDDMYDDRPPPPASAPDPPTKDDDGMAATSDFVKKLYKMLEDNSFQGVVSWNQSGDAFVVKDMNEFTKSILPRMFKHSNFASFVRQLNKYDFHKVKNSDDNQYGEHSWTFRHPDFQADRRDALENIKRKVPAQRKSTTHSSSNANGRSHGSPGASPSDSDAAAAVQALQSQVDRLTVAHDEMANHIRHLEHNYNNVLGEMVNFQRNMAQQDGLMQNLIQYFLQLEHAKIRERQQDADGPSDAGDTKNGNNPNANNPTSGGGGGIFADQNPFVASREAQRMVGAYAEDDVARASLEQLNEISRRAAAAGLTFNSNMNSSNGNDSSSGSGSGTGAEDEGEEQTAAQRLMNAAQGMMNRNQENSASLGNLSREDTLQRIQELARNRPSSAAGQQLPMHMQQQQQGQQQQHGGGGAQLPPVVLPPVATYANGSDPFIMGPQGGGQGNEMDVYSAAAAQQQQQMANGMMPPHGLTHSGLQVFTLGHLMPKSVADEVEASGATRVPAMWDGLQSGAYGPLFAGDGGDVSGITSVEDGPSASDYAQPGPSASPSTSGTGPSSSISAATSIARPGSASQKLRVRRSTFVPGWAVPPRVLLVDDDAVIRKLSSRFLQVFGCTIDVAVDGVVAVNKMNLEKYDLVLMDIVMPKLDGITATSMIRQFDHMTPIISMTANSKPTEIMTYYSSGMNDILPKPFTKEGLFTMLERHLSHLKTIQQLTTKVPRGLGIPPLSDPQFEQALMVTAANHQQQQSLPGPSSGTSAGMLGANGMDDDDAGKINPLAGMGLSDDEYAAMLQNLVSGENFQSMSVNLSGASNMNLGAGISGLGGGGIFLDKRPLDDPQDGRDGKRSRFEIID